MKPTIVVECSNDELLLRTLGVPRNRIQHGGSRNEVVKVVLRKDADHFIGLVDEDATTQHGIQRLSFKNGISRNGICVATNGKLRLVVLQPFLEGWLLAAVHACKGRMSQIDNGLSDNARALHNEFAPRGDKRMQKVIKFLESKKSKHLSELKSALGI